MTGEERVVVGFDGASDDAGYLVVSRGIGDHIIIIDDPREQLLTRDEAAAAAHVSPKTIDTWVHRGHLQAVAEGPLYREMDVLVVELATRQTPRLRRLVALALKAKHHLQQETSAQEGEGA